MNIFSKFPNYFTYRTYFLRYIKKKKNSCLNIFLTDQGNIAFFFFLNFFLFHSFALFYSKTNQSVTDLFSFYFCWTTRPGCVGYLSSGYSYIFKTRELHKGWDNYKLFLIVLFFLASANFYALAKCGKTIFPCKQLCWP